MEQEKQFYLVKLTGCDIPIEEDEVELVMKSVKSGSVRVLRRGVMNPSFFIAIVEDTDRKMGWSREVNAKIGKVVPTSKQPLKDLFPSIRGEIEKLTSQKSIGRNGLSLQAKNE